MVTLKTTSALSYFGSDAEVARELAAMLDHCQHVTIPFVGGASILPHLKARAIVANDLNNLAITFYRVISGVHGSTEKAWLMRRCSQTLSHPAEIERASEILDHEITSCDPSSMAWAYWALCWIGRKGKGGTSSMGGTPSVRWTPEGGTNATRIRSAASDLEEWAKTLERCEWTCLDFVDVLSKVKDDPRCGVYCDPPWVGAGDAYAHTFATSDHVRLAHGLELFGETTIVVRYGDHPLVRELYQKPHWTISEATARTQANKQLGEIWITNKEASR
jgi:site-specific DNA-adenine methylase